MIQKKQIFCIAAGAAVVIAIAAAVIAAHPAHIGTLEVPSIELELSVTSMEQNRDKQEEAADLGTVKGTTEEAVNENAGSSGSRAYFTDKKGNTEKYEVTSIKKVNDTWKKAWKTAKKIVDWDTIFFAETEDGVIEYAVYCTPAK